ncbi:MAG: 4'-phosphopantetheinyl transferase superfamily protein [Acidimicrobiales bacterium]
MTAGHSIGRAVELWWLNAELDADWRPYSWRVINLRERARAESFRSSSNALAFVSAHALKREVLSQFLQVSPQSLRFSSQCAFCGKAHGKPVLEQDGSLDFNLSYAGNIALVAVSQDAKVGVDIEEPRSLRFSVRATKDILANSELSYFSNVSDASLLKHWTRKEALLKASGHGLTIAPSSIEIVPAGPRRWSVQYAPHLLEPNSWNISDLNIWPHVFGALAVESEARQIEVTHLRTPRKGFE